MSSENRDPITGAKGAHPLGTGVGAAGGAATGAVIGSVAGPVGTVVGAVVGGVAGGLAGKGVAEVIDPTMQDDYWRNNYKSRPYVDATKSYDHYNDAYRYGWESRGKHSDRKWDEVESDLGNNWDQARGKSTMAWNDAKQATRDAWHAVETRLPGDADRDGR